jgi:hypothetical protein
MAEMCAAGEGAAGFKPLVEECGLLKPLNDGLLTDPSLRSNLTLYRPGAFLSQKDRENFVR